MCGKRQDLGDWIVYERSRSDGFKQMERSKPVGICIDDGKRQVVNVITWEQRKFKDVFDGLQNNTFSRADLNYESGAVKNVHYGDVLIKFGDFIDVSKDELPFITDESQTTKYNSSFLQDGDIIIADTAEDSTVGKCSEIVGFQGVKLLSGLHTIPCRPKEKYAPKFMGYYINSDAYHKQLIPLMQGIKVTSISKSALQETDMILPKSFEEQAQIGEYFSNIDHLITLHQRKCETLKKLKKSMLQKMFPKNGSHFPEIRFAGFTDAWEQRELGKIGETYTGLTGKTKEDFGHGEAKFVTYMNVFSNPVAEISMTEPIEIDKKQNEVKFGDVFFTTSSETPEEVGMSSVWLENCDNMYLNSFCFGYRPSEKINPYYMAYMLRSENVRKKITFLAQGISRYNISKNKMMEISIPLPSFEEQRQIGAYFRNLDHLITLHQRKLETLKKLKKAMLQKMFI